MLSLETQQPQSGSFKTKVAAAVVATAAIGVVAAVTLSSSDTVARKATGLFNIPEDIKGHFSGGQTTGEWTVQGKFHKFEKANGDWQIDSKLTVEGPSMGGQEIYTLKDNVLIMEPNFDKETYGEQKLECGTRDNLPAYAKWADHLKNAKTIQEEDMSEGMRKAVTENCPTGSTSVAVNVESRSYVICADSTANTRAMYAFNKDFSFSAVSREGMTVNIEHPKGWEELNCTTFDATLTREQASQLGGRLADDGDRELRANQGFDSRDMDVGGGYQSGLDTGYGVNTISSGWGGIGGGGFGGWSGGGGGGGTYTPPAKRNCAFYHGVGGDGLAEQSPFDKTNYGGLQARYDDYWGPNRVGSNCGNSLKYLNTDSQRRGYHSSQYHTEICNTLAHSDFNDASISVIFTHSMGGLTTRKAFANYACEWWGLYHQAQAPMSGSKAANLAQAACNILSGGLIGSLIFKYLLGNYCDQDQGTGAWAGYHSIYNNAPSFTWGGKKADSRLCGSQAHGLGGGIAVGLKAIQLFSGLQRRNDWCIIPKISCGWRGCRTSGCHLWWTCPYNDGMVSYFRCAKSWRHTTNAGSTSIKRAGWNHADGTGRQGDRSGGSSIDNWYKARALQNHNEAPGQCNSCLTEYGYWG
jgi:hypothetical protein